MPDPSQIVEFREPYVQCSVITPSEQIGAQVGLSAAAVQRRLKRMREDGDKTGIVFTGG